MLTMSQVCLWIVDFAQQLVKNIVLPWLPIHFENAIWYFNRLRIFLHCTRKSLIIMANDRHYYNYLSISDNYQRVSSLGYTVQLVKYWKFCCSIWLAQFYKSFDGLRKYKIYFSLYLFFYYGFQLHVPNLNASVNIVVTWTMKF